MLGIKSFSRLRDINDKIDLVVTAVPASKTMDIVKECDLIGVKRLVIVTGGFSEGGDDGKKLHQEIASLTGQYIELILNMKKSGKPFAMWYSSMDKQEMELVELVESHSLPVFQSSERAIKALSALYKYNRHRSQARTD